VPIEGVRRVPGARTWFATILVDQQGERLVVPFVDPALDRDPAWLPLDEIAEAGAVLCDMRWVEGARAAFSQARRLGVPTIPRRRYGPGAGSSCLDPDGRSRPVF